MIEFKLPSLGADMDEGTLLEWRIAPGQAVKKGDIVAVVDTSKAAIDVESWVDATVLKLVTEVGQKIPVGTLMALFGAPGEAVVEAGPAQPSGAVAPAAAPSTATAATPAAVAAMPAPSAVPARGRVKATPAARRRAGELGIALASLTPGGADGAITLADVERAAAGKGAAALAVAAAPAAPTAASRAAEMRQVIAAAMARSKREIPHYYLAETIPMRAALDWLTAANAERPITERILPAVLVLKAVALALRSVPELNGTWRDGRFVRSDAVHVGVAISLRQGGLVAPAIHDTDTRPLPQLMADLSDLVLRARAFRLRSSEMADPTITVTNLGDQGVASVFGVIYPPQVALVGIGRITERPWVDAGRLVAMPLIEASLSADHRVSDGHRGAIFLARLRELLQQPQTL